MPGYELERFIDLTNVERVELTCSICQDIFRNPVVANCCRQTFCEDCIIGWLNSNNTCPYDRKKLKQNNLQPPPRLVINMLANLRLCCQFKDKGCDQILFLENYDNHLLLCPYNRKVCLICECEELVEHNCIESLLEINKCLKKDMDSELNKNALFSQKLQEFKREKDNLLQTIQNLSKNSPVLKSKNFSKLTDYQMITESRKYLETPVVTYRKTSEEMTYKIISIAKNALNCEQNLSDLSKSVKELVESELDGLWHCTAFYDDIGSHSFTYDDMFIVSLVFGSLKITVHKVYDDINIKKLAQLLRSGKVSEELIIQKTDMNEDYISVVKEITISAIKLSNNLTNLSKYISKELSKRVDGIWHVFAFRTFLANCYVCPKIGRFVNLTISDLNIVIFEV